MSQSLRRFPLRLILILPFVLQIFAAVGLVGYLSFRNGQKAIAELARELQSEISQRIEGRLDTYTEIPATINRMNVALVRSQRLNLEDLSDLQQHFLEQLLWFPDVSSISWGNERGEFSGAFRDDQNRLQLVLEDASTNRDLVSFLSDREGNIIEELFRSPDYDPKVRPWYRTAVAARESAWTSPYPWTAEIVGLDRIVPFYEGEELKGVFAVSFTLSDISKFLESLKIGKSGQAFIFEQSGVLLGTSAKEALAIGNGEGLKALNVFESTNPVTRQTVEYLRGAFGHLGQLPPTYRDEIEIENRRYFLQVRKFQDEAGLNWTIAIVIPEADFMTQIDANTRTTIWLCLLALAIAILLGIYTSRWISQLIQHLRDASEAIASGKWERSIPRQRINELQDLASSFNRMSKQLQTILQAQQEANVKLGEQRAFLRIVIDSAPCFIFVKDWRGRFLLANQAFARFYGMTSDEIVGKTDADINDDPEEIAQFLAVDRQIMITGNTQIAMERATGANKETHNFQSIKTPILGKDSQNPQILGVATDISDLQAAELAFQESEAKNRAIVSALPDLVFHISADGIYLDVFKSTQKILDIVPNEIDPIGKHMFELLPPEIAGRQLQAARNALATGQLQIYEQEVAFEGVVQYEEVRVAPCEQNNVLVIIRNIGDRKQAELALRLEKQQSERLLLNILPHSIVDRLKVSREAIAQQHESASILFADLVGFTPLASQMSPIELVKLLDRIFSSFDCLAEEHGLEKIKTIGDAYMVAGGLPDPKSDHLEAIANMAIAMQAAMPGFHSEKLARLLGSHPLQIRIGIATGIVVAGVIGQNKFIYDLWGDTVNIASRMESTGEPEQIHVTQRVYEGLRDRYHFAERGQISVKGRGKMTTYWLLGQKEQGSQCQEISPAIERENYRV